ncbi:hypothetical protein HY634_00500 [Candidatus Uhrbacteria bacterium]|nr:hypothetical protein [Candidatus Uhrbacteria bacterium]
MPNPAAPAPVQARCMKCKEQRDVQEPKEIEMPGKGGSRRALTGKCGVCGTKMFKFLGKKDAKK